MFERYTEKARRAIFFARYEPIRQLLYKWSAARWALVPPYLCPQKLKNKRAIMYEEVKSVKGKKLDGLKIRWVLNARILLIVNIHYYLT